MTNEVSVEKRTILAQTNLTICRNELYDSPIPFLVQATKRNEIWWGRTTNADVSNGATRLSLAVLGDEQKEREDTTRQSGLYNIFESG